MKNLCPMKARWVEEQRQKLLLQAQAEQKRKADECVRLFQQSNVRRVNYGEKV